MKIGEALKKERKSHFLLQKDMVKDLNISKSHYSQIESGKHRVYTDLSLIHILRMKFIVV